MKKSKKKLEKNNMNIKPENQKKRFPWITKKRIIILVTILIIIISWYFYNKNEAKKIEAQKELDMMYEVKTGDIEVNVKVTSTANLADEQNLSFGREGKITKVNVKVGDEIKTGDILAELNIDDYQNTIDTSRLELANAKLGLEKLLYGDTSLREAQITSQINESKSSYNVELEQEEVLKNQLESIMQQKKDLLEQLTRDYNLSEKNLEIAASGLNVDIQIETEQTQDTLTSRKQTINSIINSLNSSLEDAKYIIETVDKIFGVTDDFKDSDVDSYYYLLSAKNNGYKNETKTNIYSGYNLIELYTEKIDNLDENNTDTEIYNIIQDFYNDSDLLIKLCDTALDAIDMSIESTDLTQTTLSGFTTIVNTSRSSTITFRTGLLTLSSSLNSLLSGSSQEDQLKVSIEQKKLNFDTQKIALQKKEEDINILKTEISTLEKDNKNQLFRKQTQINNILDRISVLKLELEDIIDGPDSYDIRQQKNLINQSELRLEKAIDNKDDYQIISDFDGRVRSVDIVLGEQYELDNRKFIVVENPNLIELELQVNQIDIVKIKEGDPVVITFDAYPNNPIFSAITSRDVNPEPNGRGGIYYKANILLEKQELEILAGMSAIVNIISDKAENVILVPSLALVYEGDKKFVYLREGDTYKRHEIKIGLINNFHAEVIEGLKEGDIIRSSVLDEKALKEMGIDDGSANPFGK